jgi:hypothetical protein
MESMCYREHLLCRKHSSDLEFGAHSQPGAGTNKGRQHERKEQAPVCQVAPHPSSPAHVFVQRLRAAASI